LRLGRPRTAGRESEGGMVSTAMGREWVEILLEELEEGRTERH
jgi:hypothetical protein